MAEKVAKREKRGKANADERRFCKEAIKGLVKEKGVEKVYVRIAAAIDENVTPVREYFTLNNSTPTVAKKIYNACKNLKQ